MTNSSLPAVADPANSSLPAVADPASGIAVTAPFLVLVIVVSALMAAGVTMLLMRRHSRQMQALLARLADLEADRPATMSGTALLPNELMAAEAGDADDEAEHAPPGANDPLSGRTSHVQRMVRGGGEEAETLGDLAIICIHRHLEELVQPRQLADELCVSVRTLERGLAASLACSPAQLILAMKMREARRLLLTGRYRVTEVAHRLAFTSSQHFSRRFKTFFNLTPSELMKQRDGGSA